MSSGRDPDVDQAPERDSERNGERRGYRRTQAEMEDFMSKRQKRSLFSMSGSFAVGEDEDFYRRKSNEDEDAMSRVTFIPSLPRSSSGANDDNPKDLSINKNGGSRNGDIKHLSPLHRLHLPSSLTITAASGSSGSLRIPAEFAGPSFKGPHQDLYPPGDYGRSSLTISSNRRLEHVPFSVFHDRNSAVVRPMSPSLSSAERKLLEKEDLIVERIDGSNECSIKPGPSANIQDVKSELADSPLTHISSSISSLVTDLSPRVQPSTSFLPHTTTKLPAIHHESLLKSCEFCTQSFEYETELADHVNRFHQGVKKYFCFICHKRFKRKQSLENHVNMIHSGNRGS